MNLDIKQLVATRMGNLIDSFALARDLPWRAKHEPDTTATHAEIEAEWSDASEKQGNHHFGVTRERGVFREGQSIPRSGLYDKAGDIGKRLGRAWGRDRKGVQVKPHFQAVKEARTGGTRAKFEAEK
jgi:hypothetical protein